MFSARLIRRPVRDETLDRNFRQIERTGNLQHIALFRQAGAGLIVNQSLYGQIGIFHKAQRAFQQRHLGGALQAQSGKDDAAIAHQESTRARRPAGRAFVRLAISHACVHIPAAKFDVPQFELALASQVLQQFVPAHALRNEMHSSRSESGKTFR